MIRCLEEAEKRKLSSISFPSLGTGTLGYPPLLVAKTMEEVVNEFGKTQPKYLQTVVFVLFDGKQSVQVWETNLFKKCCGNLKKCFEIGLECLQLYYIVEMFLLFLLRSIVQYICFITLFLALFNIFWEKYQDVTNVDFHIAHLSSSTQNDKKATVHYLSFEQRRISWTP